MNDTILSLQPALIWKHFYAITQIPHPSGYEELIRQYVLDFARQYTIECESDAAGNIVLRKPAVVGMENRKGIVLQAHLDMVPQKNGDTVFDFERDPLQAYIDGEWVKARGTTLGADNGIGVAAILAVFESNDLIHGPIEGLFTLTEETGMDGALGLSPELLKGEILLNLDSEEEGELCVGCAGGLDVNVVLEYKENVPVENYKSFEISVKGLKGGHSGMDIILQRGNSNKILFRFLKTAAARFGMRLASVDGGGPRNAIPRESKAVVLIPEDQVQDFLKAVPECEAVYKKELERTDPSLLLAVEAWGDLPDRVMDASSQQKLINAVYGVPNGVMRMSDSMKGLVETSTNLARITVGDGKAQVLFLLRSSMNSAKVDLAEMISSVFELAGAKAQQAAGYAGWVPNSDSPILKTARETYRSLYGKDAGINAIHAGLECGVIAGKYPRMDMISFGPTICYPHSPDEKVEIDSVGKFWFFLVKTIENTPLK